MKRSAVNAVLALALVGFGLPAAPAFAQDTDDAPADAPAEGSTVDEAPAAEGPAPADAPKPATREAGKDGEAPADAPKPATREAGKQGPAPAEGPAADGEPKPATREAGKDGTPADDGGKDGNVNNTQRTTQLEHLTQEQRADLGDAGLLDSDSDSDHHGTDNEL